MTEKKRKSKSGAPRTEVFAMRLDPKLKYLAEIAARQQRRSLANFIEWSIASALDRVPLGDSDGLTVSKAATKLWALDEPDRFIQLAKYFPELMSYDEQLIWRIICEYMVFSNELNDYCAFKKDLTKQEQNINHHLVRACWSEIKAYALGTGTKEELDSILISHCMPDYDNPYPV
jgi:hypothetical protein